jgi:hypothetical protein
MAVGDLNTRYTLTHTFDNGSNICCRESLALTIRGNLTKPIRDNTL